MELNLTRPIAFFDIETTGLQVASDRIVEIGLIKITPEGEEITKTYRINPDIPIPPHVTMIHGISNADVVNEPKLVR